MSKPLNVLISGSGIAGSVFAFWLLRAYPKANITIVERAPSLRLTGASVDIRSSAVDIIKWMGAEEEIRKHTTNEEGVQWVDTNGKPFATLMSTGREDVQSITSEFEIFRGALGKVFIDPVLDKVKLIFDETVEHYEQRDDSVIVTFAKSKETKTYDLLVAADGFSSKIRGMMLGAKPREQIYNEGVHVAYWSAKSDLLKGSKLAQWHNDTRGRVCFFRPDPNPAGRSRGHLMVITTKKDVERRQRLEKAVSEGNESFMDLLDEYFHDAGWLAPEALKSMRESDDFYCSLFGQVRSPKIHHGRVVLLGDAGYATPGIGTSLAIMGGYVLAGELLNHPDDISTALKQYGDLLHPFAKSQQGGDQAMQYLNPQTSWGLAIRDTIVWIVMGLRIDRLFVNFGSWFGLKEKKLEMPNYPWPENQPMPEKSGNL